MAGELSMRVLVVCCAVLAWPALSFCSGGHADAKVSGTVSLLDDDTAAVVQGAIVSFLRSDGEYLKVTTNEAGQYEVLLDPGYDYTMTVAGQALCEMHRPPFRPRRGSVLKFDFTTTICGIIDVVFQGESHSKPNDDRRFYRQYYRSSYDSRAPYWFFEESVALGKAEDSWLVVAFGERDEDQHGIRYGPFRLRHHIPGFSPNRLPVTLRFGTYTVQADAVKLNQKTRTLRAEGSVSIADGLNHPSREASCIVFDLNRPVPLPKQCRD
jgi:hypothetical protein